MRRTRNSLCLSVVVTLTLVSLSTAPAQAAANTYHLSETGNDANPGTAAQPWRSLARLQVALDSDLLVAGDSVLFARGSTFEGRLRLGAANSGTPSVPITFGAYGTGSAPVLSGLRALTGWQSLGDNRWRAVCGGCTGIPASLSVEGAPQPLARWPNLNEGDEGYRYFTGASGRNAITDTTLPANPNWTGAELVVRPIAWILDRLPITTHTGNTLTSSQNATYDLEPGWGYFIQNHLAAVDRDGEWVYTAGDKSITLQWPVDPNGLRIEVPVEATLLEIRNSQHVRFQDLELRGAQDDLANAVGCANIVFERVGLRLAGDQALLFASCPNSRLTASAVSDSLNNGLKLYSCGNCRIDGNTFERIGLFAGLGRNGDGNYVGAEVAGAPGNPAVFEDNAVSGIGYAAVTHYGPAITRRNVVRDWNRVKMDGAGLYTYGIADVALLNNIVLDAQGSTAGTPWSSTGTHGIYIDDNSERITVGGNTVADISGAGIFLHNTRNVTVTDNLVFDVHEAGILLIDDDLGTYGLENSYIRDNRVALREAPTIDARSTQTTALFSTLGLLDHNLYCDPFARPLFRVELPGAGSALKVLAQWQADQGRDLNSTMCAERYPTHLVSGPPGPTRVGNGAFNTDLSGWFGWPDDTLSATWETGRLDGGSLRLGYAGPAPSLHYDYPIGAVQSGQTYRLRLSAIDITGAPTVATYLRQSGAPYTRVSTLGAVPVSGSRTEYEVFFDVTADQPDTLLIFELNAPGSAVGLDNIVLQPVTADAVSLAAVTRFEVNATAAQRTLTLDGYDYRGLEGTLYPAHSSLTLQQFTSTVLLRREAVAWQRIVLPCIWR
ncbi:MAG: right-handed parallel beta-helix repeat-containing protein [Anaerolineales bacterium]|nr:right-handed parallel beta-helix repeat-containing protein [Anaerolineales bacterium]